VLLFAVLRRITGALWRSAAVAALFAVHPLHVEPVAWIAERREVLSGLFWMLSIGAYLRYVKRPSGAAYGPLVAAFACGLMSKPLIVTLPFALLLLDYWPLGRWGIGSTAKARDGEGTASRDGDRIIGCDARGAAGRRRGIDAG
jgi:hypothetical protein